MKYIKILINSLFVLSIFTACAQKDVKKDVEMAKTYVDESTSLHSKIIAVESSK